MNTRELLYCIRNDSCLDALCLGVFPIDAIPTTSKAYPYCLIQNLDDSKQEGSHWTATYVDPEGYGFYFDSYGHCPPSRIEAHLNANCHDFMHNGRTVQGVFSSCCGQHCLYFLSCKAGGYSLEEICDSYDDDDLEENDKMVTNFVNANFDMNTVRIEPEYVLLQICKSIITV